MKNLIMADFKVLGNRLWTIPLGVSFLVLLFSIIPNVSMPEALRNIFLSLLIPGLLIFELLREEKKRGSDTLIMALPVSKKIYILSKYTTIFILTITAIPAGLMANFILKLISGSHESIMGNSSFLPKMLIFLQIVLIIIYFVYPIYFLLKKYIISITSGLAILWVNFELIDSNFRYFDLSVMRNNLKSFSFNIVVVIITIAFIHILIKLIFKKIQTDKIMMLWYAALVLLSIICLSALAINLFYFYIHRIELINKYPTKDFEYLFKNMRIYISVIILMFTSCLGILFLLYKKAKDKFYFYSVFYALVPVIVFPFSLIIHILAPSSVADRIDYRSFEIALIMISIALISIKTSIYILKKNRTLK